MSKKQRVEAEQGAFSKQAISVAGIYVGCLNILCLALIFFNPDLATSLIQIVITLSTAWCVMFWEYTYNSVASKKIDGPYSQQFTKDKIQQNAAIAAAKATSSSTTTQSGNG